MPLAPFVEAMMKERVDEDREQSQMAAGASRYRICRRRIVIKRENCRCGLVLLNTN
jgi:hypothetical protein